MSNKCPKHQNESYSVINFNNNYQGNRLACSTCLYTSGPVVNDNYIGINSFIEEPIDLLRRATQQPESVRKFIQLTDYFEQDLDKKHKDVEHMLEQYFLQIRSLFRQIRLQIREMKKLVLQMKSDLYSESPLQDLRDKLQDLDFTPTAQLPESLRVINLTLDNIIQGNILDETINTIFDYSVGKKTSLIDNCMNQTIKIAEKSDDVKKLLNNYSEQFQNIVNAWSIESIQKRNQEQQQ